LLTGQRHCLLLGDHRAGQCQQAGRAGQPGTSHVAAIRPPRPKLGAPEFALDEHDIGKVSVEDCLDECASVEHDQSRTLFHVNPSVVHAAVLEIEILRFCNSQLKSNGLAIEHFDPSDSSCANVPANDRSTAGKSVTSKLGRLTDLPAIARWSIAVRYRREPLDDARG
jgi:hypothetical protein